MLSCYFSLLLFLIIVPSLHFDCSALNLLPSWGPEIMPAFKGHFPQHSELIQSIINKSVEVPFCHRCICELRTLCHPTSEYLNNVPPPIPPKAHAFHITPVHSLFPMRISKQSFISKVRQVDHKRNRALAHGKRVALEELLHLLLGSFTHPHHGRALMAQRGPATASPSQESNQGSRCTCVTHGLHRRSLVTPKAYEILSLLPPFQPSAETLIEVLWEEEKVYLHAT